MDDYITALKILPDHMQGGMQRYIDEGIPPGDFLQAVLSNDLMGAFGKADEINRASMFAFCQYLYNYAPPACFGSHAAVARWMERGGLEGDSNA